jgi:osmoprotectant transport system permease protein
MMDFLSYYYPKLLEALKEHLIIVLITLFISIIISFIITFLSYKHEKISGTLTNLFSAIYSIPSLALFAMLIPVMGLGMVPAIFVLVLYNQYILLRANFTGLSSVSPSLIEASAGMGMSSFQVFYKVKLPLALPSMFTGLHLAILSTIGIATIAATINAGGLGEVLFDGLRTMNTNKLIAGTVLTAAMAIFFDLLLRIGERFIYKRAGVQ